MHELTLVEGILQSVQELAQEQHKTVRSFKVVVGELAQFDPRVIRDLLRELRKGTPLQEAKVSVRLERAKIRCTSCDAEWSFNDVSGSLSADSKEALHFIPELVSTYFRCPSCSKSFFEVQQGRSVTLAEVRMDD